MEEIDLDVVAARVDKLCVETAGEDSAEVVPTPGVEMEGSAPVDRAAVEEEMLKVVGVESDRKPDDRTQRLFAEVLPLIREQVGTANILECRRVTRACKDAVDLAYQTDPRQLAIPAPMDPHRWYILSDVSPDWTLITEFNSPEQVQDFLRNMESHPGNPFPGRNLLIRLTSIMTEFKVEFWRSFSKVLERFGHHVHVFRVNFKAPWITEFDVFELRHDRILQNCLAHLPNLRSLAVTVDRSCGSLQYQDLDYLREHPLALLPHLETLMVDGISADLTASILASCCVPPKIRRLFLGELRRSPRGYYDEVLGFQNLDVLHTGLSAADLERFADRTQLPPLTQLYLHGQGQKDFQRLFTLLGNFGGTLKMLAVDGFVAGLRWNADYDFRVNLPHLEQLTLYQYRGPLDPFLELSSLTQITAIKTIATQPESWEGSVVEVVGIEDQMQNSNLWTLMPSLQALVIGGNDRRRYLHMYHRNKADGNVQQLC